jgi:hypothetical protein
VTLDAQWTDGQWCGQLISIPPFRQVKALQQPESA